MSNPEGRRGKEGMVEGMSRGSNDEGSWKKGRGGKEGQADGRGNCTSGEDVKGRSGTAEGVTVTLEDGTSSGLEVKYCIPSNERACPFSLRSPFGVPFN